MLCNFFMVPVAHFLQGDAFPVSESSFYYFRPLYTKNTNTYKYNTILISLIGLSFAMLLLLKWKPFVYALLQEYKIINASVRIDWPGAEKPADQPICGFLNELCPKDDTHITSMVAAGVLGLVLFCAGVITMSIYRKWKIELEIEGLLWKIESQEIKGYFNNDIVSSPSKV